jgi:hypothetical protein
VTSDAATRTREGAFARGWRTFRIWRRSRPFWGGLWTLLGGLEIFLSTQLQLEMQIRIGVAGLLSILVPTVISLCGLLIWMTPQHRIFYAVIALLVSLYSFVGVNFGGFFIGMLLGLVGGSLTLAWTPIRPAATSTEDPSNEVTDGDSQDPADEVLPWEQPGPLTDTLPHATTLPDAADPRWGTGPGEYRGGEYGVQNAGTAADEENPPNGPGRLPRRSRRLGVAIGVPLLITAAIAVAVLRSPSAAMAMPCPPDTTTTSATASATPTPSPSDSSDLVESVVDGVGDIVGGVVGQVADESPSPSASPSPNGGSDTSCDGDPGGGPDKTPTIPGGNDGGPLCGPVKEIPVPDGQPTVAAEPGKMTTASLSMSGASYDGVVDLPTATGTRRALQFTMDSSSNIPFQLRTTNGATLTTSTRNLTVTGHVRFYASRFHGNLAGIGALTFTPTCPPPLIVPGVPFTDVAIDLVFVRSDVLTAPDLSITLS